MDNDDNCFSFILATIFAIIMILGGGIEGNWGGGIVLGVITWIVTAALSQNYNPNQ
ncbi:MAG: hypothetical protein LUC88_01965 [Prevotella sp.]|nr:hypothetical protein [Prevotella sp.]